MLIKHVTRGDLEVALAQVNARFEGNIRFKRIDQQGKTTWRVTLKVADSHGKGGSVVRRLYNPFVNPIIRHRHTGAACWHVHGYFFDALPPDASILARGTIRHPGGQWEDYETGSRMFPTLASEDCYCGGIK